MGDCASGGGATDAVHRAGVASGAETRVPALSAAFEDTLGVLWEEHAAQIARYAGTLAHRLGDRSDGLVAVTLLELRDRVPAPVTGVDSEAWLGRHGRDAAYLLAAAREFDARGIERSKWGTKLETRLAGLGDEPVAAIGRRARELRGTLRQRSDGYVADKMRAWGARFQAPGHGVDSAAWMSAHGNTAARLLALVREFEGRELHRSVGSAGLERDLARLGADTVDSIRARAGELQLTLPGRPDAFVTSTKNGTRDRLRPPGAGVDPADWLARNGETAARLLAVHREAEQRMLDLSPAQRDPIMQYVKLLGPRAKAIEEDAKRLAKQAFRKYPTADLVERLRAVEGPLQAAREEPGTSPDAWLYQHQRAAAVHVAVRRELAQRAAQAPERDRAAGDPARNGPAQDAGIGS